MTSGQGPRAVRLHVLSQNIRVSRQHRLGMSWNIFRELLKQNTIDLVIAAEPCRRLLAKFRGQCTCQQRTDRPLAVEDGYDPRATTVLRLAGSLVGGGLQTATGQTFEPLLEARRMSHQVLPERATAHLPDALRLFVP